MLRAKEIAKECNVLFHTHLSETKTEMENSLQKHGKTPVKHLYDFH